MSSNLVPPRVVVSGYQKHPGVTDVTRQELAGEQESNRVRRTDFRAG